MPNRSVKLVPALFAGILAGANLATVTDLRAQAQTKEAAAEQPKEAAADTCLSGPKGATPAGGHWYYRIDRATKRQCWYLRDGSDKADNKSKPDKSARAAPEDSSTAAAAAAEPTPPQPRTMTRKAIADARAEWTSQQARTEQNSSASAQPQSTGTPTAPTVQDNSRAIVSNVFAPVPLATTRWTDTTRATSSGNPIDPRSAAVDPPPDQPQQAEEVQQPAPLAVAAAPAPVPPMEKPTASMQMLLLVMAAALALAGITVSLILRFGRARARAVMRRNRSTMWDSAPAATQSTPMMHARESLMRGGNEAVMRRPVRVHEPRAPEARDRQVNDMLGRLARSAQS